MGGIDGGNIVRHQVYGSNSVFKPHPKTKTNADRIRAMSDEELAGWISNLLNECIPCDGCNRSLCWEDSCLKWLQQPAEEDDHA